MEPSENGSEGHKEFQERNGVYDLEQWIAVSKRFACLLTFIHQVEQVAIPTDQIPNARDNGEIDVVGVIRVTLILKLFRDVGHQNGFRFQTLHQVVHSLRSQGGKSLPEFRA